MAVISPQQRALLDTISKAEGTWDSKANRPRYDITFGYQSVDPSKPHPGRVVRSGGYASDATGAYQFLSPTWKGANGGVNAAMTPENQDLAALELVRRRGVDPNKPLDGAGMAKLAPEWASLPNLAGKSHYGQPVKKRDELLSFYGQRLGATPSAPATATPAAGGGAVAAGGGGDLTALLPALMGNPAGIGDLSSLIGSSASTANPLLAIGQANQQSFNTLLDSIDIRQPAATPQATPGGGADPARRLRFAGQVLASLA